MSHSGAGLSLKDYPGIVRAGIHLMLDTPFDAQIRFDPDGERKAEERARRNLDATRRLYGSDTHPLIVEFGVHRVPPCKTIHLQWLDTSYKPVWRDTAVRINLEKRRFHEIEDWMIGRQHHGSGAIGVTLFSAPVLAVLSPYLLARDRIYRMQERKHGMSRHGIALMKRLKGQLDPATEALLVETFKNEWKFDRKMRRQVTFDEARELLDASDLSVTTYSDEGSVFPGGEDRHWHDGDGDRVASIQLVDGEEGQVLWVLGSQFEGEEARELMQRCRTREEKRYEKNVRP